MADLRGKKLIGKVVVSEEGGKKFGTVGDVSYVSDSGELMNVILTDTTKHVKELQVEQDESGRNLIPFSSIKSVGDFVIVSEKDIV
ncbi:MAG: PRC-barrel domain-containing protein [Candidatus Aenigmatarchaeota archaeon]